MNIIIVLHLNGVGVMSNHFERYCPVVGHNVILEIKNGVNGENISKCHHIYQCGQCKNRFIAFQNECGNTACAAVNSR